MFVHFKEKESPDGEQVYFAVSTDGMHWEKVNRGEPVLWSEIGERGVRDHTIARLADGRFVIVSTDLSLARNFRTKYEGSWDNVARYGSRCLSLWESEDLIRWSEQRLIELGDENFGCLWAPDILRDEGAGDYVLHWSSRHASNDFGNMAIYFARTKDFRRFSEPQLLCRKDDSSIIDSAIYREDGKYYRFLKKYRNPEAIILEKGATLRGPYERIEAFDEEMAKLGSSAYEAPTAFKLKDGRWCLMLDFFGVKGEGQGYVPFIADEIDSGRFIRSDDSFSFPYRFKHGTVLSITLEEYERVKQWK
nr:glycoside hydrolase family 43 protein [Cohnella thailandensis]